MTKFEVLFRILLIVVILRHSSGEKENFCANCFRWIDSFCRVDKDELRPKDESDLSKFQNLTDGEVKDPHFQKCLLPHQKVVGLLNDFVCVLSKTMGCKVISVRNPSAPRRGLKKACASCRRVCGCQKPKNVSTNVLKISYNLFWAVLVVIFIRMF